MAYHPQRGGNSNAAECNPSDSPAEIFPPLVERAIVLTGPTASGKSEVAVNLAERIGGEILSLDSIAVYRAMDIGTAKPTADQRRRVAHHLIDLVEPDQEFSVACYLRAAHAEVDRLSTLGRPAIFVGGTPMFLKGVLRGFDPGPPPDWEFREAVEADIERHGLEALRQRLRQVDPLAAHRIGPGDRRRMIRALEVARHTGQPLSHRQNQFQRGRDAERCRVFAFQWQRGQLHQRIERRVHRMFDAGLIDEVRGLIERYGGLSRTARQAVGYREVIDWLHGNRPDPESSSKTQTLEELKQLVIQHTRQLARRQETWLRSLSEVRPVPLEPTFDAENVAEWVGEKLETSGEWRAASGEQDRKDEAS